MNIFTDGGARGNPGPAAIAFIIQNEAHEVLLRETRFIGVATNNQAEYHAVLAALKTAATLKPETVTCYSDSELVVKQLRGEYAVKNSVLKHLWKDVQDFKKGFREVQFVHVPRSHSMIAEADSLVNRALDAQQNIR